VDSSVTRAQASPEIAPCRLLEGRAAIVTGGARGIGRGIAQVLLDRGARVLVASRTKRDLDEAVELLSAHGDVGSHVADVSDPSAVQDLVDAALERFDGGLDIFVGSHGVYNATVPFLELTKDQWDRTLAINLTGNFLCGQAAARVMVAGQRPGRIIFISSINGRIAEMNASDYNVSKAGIHLLAKTMALDLGEYGITVNAIAPGWIQSPMSAPYLSEDLLAGRERVNALRRVGMPVEIGSAAAWLAQDDAAYVTGSVIVVDGGHESEMFIPTEC
jgi:NAD(P)-dependent dehydrogenase (short-subunit alcohol dehydrogenase family)